METIHAREAFFAAYRMATKEQVSDQTLQAIFEYWIKERPNGEYFNNSGQA